MVVLQLLFFKGLQKHGAEAWWLQWTTQKRSGRSAAKKSYPTSKEWQLPGCRRAERSSSTFKVRRGGREKIALIQGQEQP